MSPKKDWDHGVWVPLSLMYPDGDLSVVQLSLPIYWEESELMRLGDALARYESDSVMVMGSGNVTHNLRSLIRDEPTADPTVQNFRNGVEPILRSPDKSPLRDWLSLPQAGILHPSPEHFLPLLVATGTNSVGRCLHRSVEHATLAMDSWEFTRGSTG